MSTASFIARRDDRLSLRIPGSAWKASGQRAAAAMAQKGALIAGVAIQDWALEDMREEGSWVVVSGPAFNGLSLAEALASGLGKADALKSLSALASGLQTLAKAGRLPERIYEEGILFGTDGSLLILPMDLTASACAAQNPNAFLSFGKSPEQGAALLLSSMVRRVCAQGRDDAPLGVELALLEPSLDRELAALVDRGNKKTVASIDEYRDAFDAASRRGFFRALSADEEKEANSRLQASIAMHKKREALSRFFKRKGNLLLGIGIGLAAVVAIILMSRATPGPDYSDLGAPDLIAAYYEALNSLDMMSLDACVSGAAGKDDRNFVGNLSVIRKMRQAYGEADLFINAKDWLGQGSPALGEGEVLFGISGLTIRELALGIAPGSFPAAGASEANPAELQFEARYAIWSSYNADENYRVVKNDRIDTIRIKKGKQGWKIYRIERASQ